MLLCLLQVNTDNRLISCCNVCRLFRHDGLGELFSVLQNFNDAGGIASLLGPQHGKGRQQLSLPSAVQDKSLQTYISVQVEDLLVPKRGPSVSFEVSLNTNNLSNSGHVQTRCCYA